MATNTTNFNLSKPAYTDTADIAVINSNMDKVDTSLQGLGTGLAIISNANTHVAITSGQYVYVHGHGSLAEGLYTAKSNISANATLSTSNLQAVSGGGLNALNRKFTWKQIYVNATYTNHVGVTLQLSESLQNVKLLFVTAYTQSISSTNRIVFIIPVNSNIGASYFCVAYGTSVQTIRVEGSNTSFTVLSSSLTNGLFINEIVALG